MSHVALLVAGGATLAVLVRGREASLGSTLVLLALGFAALAGVVFCELRSRSLRRSVVLSLGAVLLVAAVVSPPAQSSDVWLYGMYGRMVSRYHANPYAHVPDDFPDDAIHDRVATGLGPDALAHGPGFIGAAAAGTAVARASPLATRLFFQGLAALALAAVVLIVDRRTRDPVAIALLVGEPGGGRVGRQRCPQRHARRTGRVGGVLLAADRRLVLAGVAMALGALVKIIAVLPSRRSPFGSGTGGGGVGRRRSQQREHSSRLLVAHEAVVPFGIGAEIVATVAARRFLGPRHADRTDRRRTDSAPYAPTSNTRGCPTATTSRRRSAASRGVAGSEAGAQQPSARAITRCWISLVPSPISSTLASQ